MEQGQTKSVRELEFEVLANRRFSLSIVIPQYNETDDIIRPLLSSIETQRGVNFNDIEIIIVNDHSETKLSQELFDRFNHLNIRYLETPENKGPGQARQYGIDHAEKEYVVFADADDRFFSCNVFSDVFNALMQNKDKVIDIVYTKWIEELVSPQAGYLLIPHTPDMTWVHGKFIRTQFLAERNLRFNDRIRVHEDSYFNSIVQMNAGITITLDTFSYFWCYNPKSLTRKEYKYNYLVETAKDLVISINDTMDALIQRKTKGRDEYIIKAIFFMYFLLQAPYWNEKLNTDEELRKLRYEYEQAIYNTINKYRDSYDRVTRQDVIRFKNDERAQCSINTGFESEVETWEQFLQRLDDTYAPKKYTHTCKDCKYYKEGKECKYVKDCTMQYDRATRTYSTPSKWAAVEPKSTEVKGVTTKSAEEH